MKLFLRSLRAVVRLGLKFLADYFRVMRGVWKLAKLDKPIVSIFGGSKMGQDHPSAGRAHKLSSMLMDNDFSVITGGGPGIMQAANCGAFEKGKKRKARSIAITVYGLSNEARNACADDYIETYYFFARKFLLTYRSTAFVVFPGGFGTADELFLVLTLMQTGKIRRMPIVLMNKTFWKPMVDWVENSKKEGLLLQKDADLLFVTDSVEEAFDFLCQHCK